MINSCRQEARVSEVRLALRSLSVRQGRVLQCREAGQASHLTLRAFNGVPHAQIVHVVHLLVRAGRGVPLLHIQKVKSFGLLMVTLPLRNTWRVQAYLLYSLYLLLPLIFPAPNIVIGLPILQSLQQCLVLQQDTAHLLSSLVAVEALADPAARNGWGQLLLLPRHEERLGLRQPSHRCLLGRQQSGLRGLVVRSSVLLVFDVNLAIRLRPGHRLPRGRPSWALAPHPVRVPVEPVQFSVLKLRQRHLLPWLAPRRRPCNPHPRLPISNRSRLSRLIERVGVSVFSILLRLYHLQ